MFHALTYFTCLFRTNDKIFQLFKWVGNLFVFIGAICFSVSIEASQEAWPFAIATIGSIVWISAAKIMEDKPLLWYQTFFLFINGYATMLRS